MDQLQQCASVAQVEGQLSRAAMRSETQTHKVLCDNGGAVPRYRRP